MNIAQDLKDIIADKLGVAPSEITMNTSFQNDLGTDSLDIVDLIMEAEMKFNIEIPDEEVETIATVGDAIRYIEKKLGVTTMAPSYPQSISSTQLERDMAKYADDTFNKGDLKAGFLLLSEITGGIAIFGLIATALTSWLPGAGIPISSAMAAAAIKKIAEVYADLPTEDRRIIIKCANFLKKIV